MPACLAPGDVRILRALATSAYLAPRRRPHWSLQSPPSNSLTHDASVTSFAPEFLFVLGLFQAKLPLSQRRKANTKVAVAGAALLAKTNKLENEDDSGDCGNGRIEVSASSSSALQFCRLN
ncbi:hypothetical protein VNO80_05531 [Phaseolus coccineus]|uniref:Uncharacterized protein n=1 Tax=Phaseolus coccineus TaxID=3886 RepID=A0AAN9NG55_PHACN